VANAIKEALPGFGDASAEKIRVGAVSNAFNKMLTGQDNTTLADVLTLAAEVQDPRVLEYVVRESKSSTYQPAKDINVEIRALKTRLDELGLRALLFDR